MVGAAALWVGEGVRGDVGAEGWGDRGEGGLFEDGGGFYGMEGGGVADGMKGSSEE